MGVTSTRVVFTHVYEPVVIYTEGVVMWSRISVSLIFFPIEIHNFISLLRAISSACGGNRSSSVVDLIMGKLVCLQHTIKWPECYWISHAF